MARYLPIPDLLLLLFGLGILMFLVPHAISGDGQARYLAMQSLIEHGRIEPMKYSHVLPLAAAPFYGLGKLFMGPEWWVARANTFFFCCFLVFLARHFRARLAPGELGGFLLLLTLCSMLPHHLMTFYGEVLTLCLAGSGLLLLPERPGTATALLTLAVVNTPAALPAVALACLLSALESRRWSALLPPVLGGMGVLAENLLLRGGLFDTGYSGDHGNPTLLPYSGQPGFSYPFILGLYGILFSSGKGLLFFAPGLTLTRAGRMPRVWLAFLVGLVLVYASWWAWYGGFFWGPRFFLFASLPASLALALALHDGGATRTRRAISLVVLLLSAWVGYCGLAFGQTGLDICVADNYAMEHLCWYVPEFSPLVRPLLLGVETWGTDRWMFGLFALAVILRVSRAIWRE